jgi:hypothetical protein
MAMLYIVTTYQDAKDWLNPSFIKYKNPSFIKYKNPSFIKYKNPSFTTIN